MTQSWEVRLKESDSTINVDYVRNILGMDEDRFEVWFKGTLVGLHQQEAQEFFSHLSSADQNQGTCRLGRDILSQKLKFLAFLLDERYRKFDAINLSELDP